MSSTQEVGEIFGEGSGPAHAMLRSPTVLIAACGLWGMNVLLFKIFKIDYVKVLNHDLVKEKKEQELSLSLSKRSQHDGGSGSGGTNVGNSSSSADISSDNGTTNATTTTHRAGSKIKKSSTSTPDNDAVAGVANGVDSNGDHTQQVHQRQNTKHHTSSSVIVVADGTEITIDHDDDKYDLRYNQSSSSTNNDADGTITWNKLVFLSVSLLCILHYSTHIWMNQLGGGFIGAVMSFYFAVMLVIVMPIPQTKWIRKCATIIFQRAYELINPRCYCLQPTTDRFENAVKMRPIPFIDVFFADAMCSLSKVFFDWGMLWHMASHYPEAVPPAVHNILIPSIFAGIPYIIRARQCLIMYSVGVSKNCPKRFEHILNAIKYSTSIFPICLSAYQKVIDPEVAERLEKYLIIMLVVNASYSFYWDICMDWGMMKMSNPASLSGNFALCAGGAKPVETAPLIIGETPKKSVAGIGGASTNASCTHTILRPRLRFGVGLSSTILITDAILRFSWTLRFYSAGIFPNADTFVLVTQFLEVFRRAIWNLLRVEWENLKQQKALKEAPSKISSSATVSSSSTRKHTTPTRSSSFHNDATKKLQII